MALNPDALSVCLVQDLAQVLSGQVAFSNAYDRGWPGMSVREAAAVSQKQSLLKKFLGGNLSAKADQAAVDQFLVDNAVCQEWTLRLESSKDEVLFGTCKRVLEQFLYPEGLPLVLGLPQLLSRGRPGPGASVGAQGCDFYTKHFSSPMTTTKASLADAYVRYFANDHEWMNGELTRQATYGSAQVVPGSKLLTVLKNVDISRVICVEPSINMFLQLGLGGLLEDRLAAFFGIRLDLQPAINRELARWGSVDGQYCTLDLKHASNLISLRMLREVLPAGFVQWLELLRSPVATLPSGETVTLNMVSTMGNGYTFPLQTAIFAAVVVSAYLVNGLEPKMSWWLKPGNFGVFGDDIICHTSVWRDVVRLLTLLGFSLNADKSFVEGPFRESCGGDYFNGHDIRPVYLKQLDDLQDFSTAVNQLVLWSAKTGIPLVRTIDWLMCRGRRLASKQRTLWPNYVPPWENEDSGIRVPLSFMGHTPTLKASGFMYLATKPKEKVLRPLEPPEVAAPSVRVPRGEKARIYNPGGLLLAVLHGSWRGRGISVRTLRTRYSLRRCVAPTWDQSATSLPAYNGRCSQSRWESAAVCLLAEV